MCFIVFTCWVERESISHLDTLSLFFFCRNRLAPRSRCRMPKCPEAAACLVARAEQVRDAAEWGALLGGGDESGGPAAWRLALQLAPGWWFQLPGPQAYLLLLFGEGSPTKIHYRKKWVPLFYPLKSGGPEAFLHCSWHVFVWSFRSWVLFIFIGHLAP